MASSSAKATYKTNGYATWNKSEDVTEQSSITGSFLKSLFGGSPSTVASVAKAKEANKLHRDKHAQGGEHKRVDSLDLGRRLGHCYAESAKRSSLGASSGGDSSGKGRSDHSHLSVATQLSLSSSGKISRSGHRPKIDHCNRRMPSCGMYKYDQVTGMVSPAVGGGNGGESSPAADAKNNKKHVVIMEP